MYNAVNNLINPYPRIGVKYSLIVWAGVGGGGILSHVSVLPYLVKMIFFSLIFWIETYGIYHNKASINRDIYFY